MFDPNPVAMGLAGVRLAETDRRQFRISVGHPWDYQGVGVDRQPEDGAADNQPGLRSGQVGELPAAGDVADRKDAAVCRRTQHCVRRHSQVSALDFGLVEVEAVERRRAADGDQQMRAADPPLALRSLDDDGGAGFDADRLVAGQEFNAVDGELLQNDIGRGPVLAIEHLAAVDDHDIRPQPAKRLAKFDADRAAAQHDQLLRQGVEIEHRLVGQIGGFGEAGDGRGDCA